jgi:hypothetical protein
LYSLDGLTKYPAIKDKPIIAAKIIFLFIVG